MPPGEGSLSQYAFLFHFSYKSDHSQCCSLRQTVMRSLTPNFMQDAFTKTVPIWCAVLNRVVRNVKQHSQLARHADDGVLHESPTSEAEQWDGDLHLPPWVSENEANHISIRLDGWTEELLQVCWSKTSSCCSSCMLTSLRQSRA